MPLKLFISYRSLDAAKVDALVTRLSGLKNADTAPRYKLWQDKKDIAPGQDWWEAIVDAIIACDIFVFHVSAEAVRSEVCRAELHYARERNRMIIPVVLEDEFWIDIQTDRPTLSYWDEIPADLSDYKTHFLFYQGAGFFGDFEKAVSQYDKRRYRDIERPRPADPRGGTDAGDDSIGIYDRACDYAGRAELGTARHLFQKLILRNDPSFYTESAEWIEILGQYEELIRTGTVSSTHFRLQTLWTEYKKLFPKNFIEGIFDPREFAKRMDDATSASAMSNLSSPSHPAEPAKTMAVYDVYKAIEGYYTAYDAQQWEEARLILSEIERSGAKVPHTFKLEAAQADVVRGEAEKVEAARLVASTTEREQEYNILRRLAKAKPSNNIHVWQTLQDFQKNYPFYDPDNLGQRNPYNPEIMPAPFSWITIPPGKVSLEAGGYIKRQWFSKRKTFDVECFEISKYPITNSQYQKFIDAGGYSTERWWTEAGWKKCQDNLWNEIPRPAFCRDWNWNKPEQPVTGVTWYECIAFCRWLSEITKDEISLPTEQEWQRAAQGDSDIVYPWGNEWDSEYYGSKLNGEVQLGLVHDNENKNKSPYDVVGMVGNIWEWCITGYEDGNEKKDGDDIVGRVLKGGYGKAPLDSRVSNRYAAAPYTYHRNYGFRCVRYIQYLGSLS